MIHLRKYKDSEDENRKFRELMDEVQDFCETRLAYLLDEGFSVNVSSTEGRHILPKKFDPNRVVTINLHLSAINRVRTNKRWFDVRDYLIPFISLLNNNYDIKHISLKVAPDNNVDDRELQRDGTLLINDVDTILDDMVKNYYVVALNIHIDTKNKVKKGYLTKLKSFFTK
jgi:hypothetical protein